MLQKWQVALLVYRMQPNIKLKSTNKNKKKANCFEKVRKQSKNQGRLRPPYLTTKAVPLLSSVFPFTAPSSPDPFHIPSRSLHLVLYPPLLHHVPAPWKLTSGLGNAVSSPSRVWGEVPADINFGVFWEEKFIWHQLLVNLCTKLTLLC